MEMHQVRYFMATAKHLNFTRAADELQVAQPSLTRAILKLEEELDGPLFRRERSNTHLTELGRMMLPHLQAALTAAEEAKSEARRFRHQERGTLMLGVCISVEAGTALALLIGIARDLVGLDLAVEVAPQEEIERRLMAGELDAAILALIGGAQSRFDFHLIQDDAFAVAFKSGHRFADEAEVAFEALDSEPLVVRSGCRHEDALAAAMEARGITRHVRHRSNDMRWIGEFVRAGLGCAILPASVASAHGLAHRPIADLSLRHRTALTTVAGRRHSAALAALIHQLSRVARPRVVQAAIDLEP